MKPNLQNTSILVVYENSIILRILTDKKYTVTNFNNISVKAKEKLLKKIKNRDHKFFFHQPNVTNEMIEIESKKINHPASDDPQFSDLDLPRYVVLNLRRGGIRSSAELIQAYKSNPESIRKIHHIGNKKWHIIKNAIESR